MCDALDDRLFDVVVREVAVTKSAPQDPVASAIEPVGTISSDHAQLASSPQPSAIEDAQTAEHNSASEEADIDGESQAEDDEAGVTQTLYPQQALFMRQCLPESAWESDDATATCRQCSRRFLLFIRRHHCRRCGLVFCDSCSSRRALLASPISPAQSGYHAPAQVDDNTPLIQVYAATTQGMRWQFREHRVCDPCVEAVRRLPVASANGMALVAARLGSATAIENAYNIFRDADGLPATTRSMAYTQPLRSSATGASLSESSQQPTMRRSSTASIRVCPVCDKDWATVWSAMIRVPGEGWQEAQERHIRECIEDTSAEMQGAHRHQGARDVRRSRSVHSPMPASDSPVTHALAVRSAASQPRRAAGFLGLFERASLTDTSDMPTSPEAPAAQGGYGSRDAPREDEDHHAVRRAARSPLGVKYVAYKLNGDTPLLGEECPICFEDFEPGQHVARLNCLCTYHVLCIREWIQRTPACPVHYE
ncbi:hypothetical protein GGI04_001523 [Coemansia thaxteri]|nr:hypothetical protein GGI04_001523 [Coemansia thaxteri]